MLTLLYLSSGVLAALGFYLTTAHQRLRASLRPNSRVVRMVAWLLTAASLVAAVQALGLWAGVFSSLSVVMLGMVLLPYADAWLHARSTRDVG